MKIGIVTEYYYPTLGGVQEHVHHFTVAARRFGHDVRILTPAVTDRLASTGRAPKSAAELRGDDEAFGVVRIGRSIPLLAGGSIARASIGRGLSRQLGEVMKAEGFDVLHLHSPLMPTLPLLALRLSDSVNVGTFHSVMNRSRLLSLFSGFLRPYVERMDAVIGVSETALEGVRAYFQANYHVIPNGVDVTMFAGGKRRPELDDGRLNVLHVGRFDPRNGVDRVIKAWTHARRAGADARLVLVGDGPLRPTYEAMVPADLRADVRFVGFVPSEERRSYYASGDVLLCPALGGTFGIIVLEAMAAGCAVVAADTPGFRNVMQDGVQGFMVDVAADPSCARLGERTAELLNDADLRRRCATAGRQTAARFDWPVVTEKVIALYEDLLGGTQARTQAREAARAGA
jgi:phosphatidylinositol alpha-mannosyltransferase